MSKKLSELLNLEKAYNQVLADERSGQDFLPDVLNFLDSKKTKSQMLQELRQEIDNNRFEAKDLAKIDVPKDNFFIRPGARPCLKDWILYQALANYIGSKADKKLGRNVYSARFDSKTGNLIQGSDQWLKFERAFWANFEAGFKYVLKTDVTAYFVNINIETLRACIFAVLDKSEESDKIIKLLFDGLLRPWSETAVNKGFGLPQGINPSRVLANLLLLHVDALISRDKKLRYLRYMDDMRILARTEIEAKRVLRMLISGLRDIGLDLNEKKTQILNPLQVEQELRDPRRPDLDMIQTALKSRNKALIRIVALPLLSDLFERSFDSSNTFGDRHLRFSINNFVRLRAIYKGRNKVIITIGLKLIDKLESMPGSANVFSRFFGVFPQHSFKKQLIKFLKSDNNIYEWQEMHILDSLLRFQSFSQSELRIFREIAFDRDKHPLCRSKAILLLGKFGDEHERYELRRKFTEEEDAFLVKRALIIATQELSIAERNNFYSTIKKTDPEKAPAVEYIKNLPKPIYFDEYVAPPITAIEEEY